MDKFFRTTHPLFVISNYDLLLIISKAHLQELLKSRFSISRDLNFMLPLSVRFNLTKTE
jgi:hypothetical protein